jgi:hypothetical protein
MSEVQPLSQNRKTIIAKQKTQSEKFTTNMKKPITKAHSFSEIYIYHIHN